MLYTRLVHFERGGRYAVALVLSCLGLVSSCAPPSLGEACDRMGQTYCNRIEQCNGDAAERSQCLRTIYAGCCDGIVCTEPVRSPAAVDSCLGKLPSHSCTLIAQSLLPTDCYGALAPPPAEVGGLCGTIGAEQCEAGGDRLLVCVQSAWALKLECRGPMRCQMSGPTASCDSSGNTKGDRCESSEEGKERCDPANASVILRCRSGVLVGSLQCPVTSRCQAISGTTTCVN